MMSRMCALFAVVATCLHVWSGVSLCVGGEPAVRSFNIREYGARGDGETIDTHAIQQAIDACHTAGGGRVLLPRGRYPSGTLRLRNGVTLHIDEGARLTGVKDLTAYAGFEAEGWRNRRWNRALIIGEGLHNIAITGDGMIDGNRVFDPQGEEKMRGPHTIMLIDCQGVTLRDLTIRDSANYAFLFYACSDVHVEDATFEGGWDAIHFRGVDFKEGPARWNRNVQIRRCRFFTGDDCIAGHYIEDAIVEDCVINSSCNGVRIIGPARRLTFRRCEFFGPGRFPHRTSKRLNRTNMLAGLLIQPSAWTPTPGPLEDLVITDVTMRNVACALHVSIREDNTGTRLLFERLKATDVYSSAVSMESWADEPLGRVTLRDIDVAYTPDAFDGPRIEGKPAVQSPIRKPGVGVWGRKLPVWGFYGRNIGQLHLDRIRLMTNDLEDARPVVRADDVDRFRLEHLQHSPAPAGTQTIECNAVRSIEKDETPESPSSPRTGRVTHTQTLPKAQSPRRAGSPCASPIRPVRSCTR